MKKARIWLVVIICVLAILWIAWKIEERRSMQALTNLRNGVEHEISQQLPNGSSVEMTENFLADHGFKYDHYVVLGQDYRNVYGGATGILDATTEQVSTSILKCRILLNFRFDEERKLISHRMQNDCQHAFLP